MQACECRHVCSKVLAFHGFLMVSFLPPAVRLPFNADAALHWPPPGYRLHSESQMTYPVFDVLPAFVDHTPQVAETDSPKQI